MAKNVPQYSKHQGQPYSNMAARRLILLFGLLLTIAAFVLVVVGILGVFIPNMNIGSLQLNGLGVLVILFACALGASFVGIVFTLAGANTAKGIARLSFFFGVLAFVAAAALLVITLFFKTLLPVDALNRLMA